MKNARGWGRELWLKYFLPAGLFLGLLAGTLYSLPGDVEVINTVSPKNSGSFPVVRMGDVQGGYRSVADIAARNAITTGRRVSGMMVKTVDTGDLWVLQADLTTWLLSPGNRFMTKTAGGQVIYVRSAGNDTTGNGLTVGTAYATVQRALDDINQAPGFKEFIRVDVGPMTITDTAWTVSAIPSYAATSHTGMITIRGDCTTPDITVPGTGTLSGSVVVDGDGVTKFGRKTYAVGAYGATITDGSDWVMEGTWPVPFFSASTVLASASPDLILEDEYAVRSKPLSVCPYTTLSTGALNIYSNVSPRGGGNGYVYVSGISFSNLTRAVNVVINGRLTGTHVAALYNSVLSGTYASTTGGVTLSAASLSNRGVLYQSVFATGSGVTVNDSGVTIDGCLFKGTSPAAGSLICNNSNCLVNQSDSENAGNFIQANGSTLTLTGVSLNNTASGYPVALNYGTTATVVTPGVTGRYQSAPALVGAQSALWTGGLWSATNVGVVGRDFELLNNNHYLTVAQVAANTYSIPETGSSIGPTGTTEPLSSKTLDGGVVANFFNVAGQQRFMSPGVQNIYVMTGGSDSVCDGTTSAVAPGTLGACAYATIPRALLDVPNLWRANVIINVGPMTISAATTLRLTVVPGDSTVASVVILGDCTNPVMTLPTTGTGTPVTIDGVVKKVRTTFSAVAYGDTITDGSHWLKKTSAGIPSVAAITLASTTPNLVLVGTTTAKTNVSVCPYTTIFSGGLFVNGPLDDYVMPLSIMGMASTYSLTAYRANFSGMQLSGAHDNYIIDTSFQASSVTGVTRFTIGSSTYGNASLKTTLFNLTATDSSLTIALETVQAQFSTSVINNTSATTSNPSVMIGRYYPPDKVVPSHATSVSISNCDFEGTHTALSLSSGSSVQMWSNSFYLTGSADAHALNAYHAVVFTYSTANTGKVAGASILANGSYLMLTTGWSVANTVNPNQDWYVGTSPVLSTAQLPYNNVDTGDVATTTLNAPVPTHYQEDIIPRGRGVHAACTGSAVWYQNTADAGTDQTLCFCKQVGGVWTATCL